MLAIAKEYNITLKIKQLEYSKNSLNNSNDQICERYNVVLPGHQCYIDLASVEGLSLIDYSYNFTVNYHQFNSGMYMGIDLVLNFWIYTTTAT